MIEGQDGNRVTLFCQRWQCVMVVLRFPRVHDPLSLRLALDGKIANTRLANSSTEMGPFTWAST